MGRRLSAYNYTRVDVKASDNLWVDVLGRWSASIMSRRLVYVQELPTITDSFECPSIDKILEQQKTYLFTKPDSLTLRDGLGCENRGAVRIPDDSSELQLRLCVIAHTVASGHRRAHSTINPLKNSFNWTFMRADVQTFVRSCVHFLSPVGGKNVPRPFCPAFHGEMVNDLF